ncbi:MAG: hypothetical protein MUD00_00570 [Candidatus Pacebacteria bacterium]|jgi:hypothetical protein|nr:hypothetical protein [Candidatus Paceibacterota bacterium]
MNNQDLFQIGRPILTKKPDGTEYPDHSNHYPVKFDTAVTCERLNECLVILREKHYLVPVPVTEFKNTRYPRGKNFVHLIFGNTMIGTADPIENNTSMPFYMVAEIKWNGKMSEPNKNGLLFRRTGVLWKRHKMPVLMFIKLTDREIEAMNDNS